MVNEPIAVSRARHCADQDRNRDLLRDVDPRELYEAGLTVMMRLVFLLAAEERGLLLLGDPRYDSFYAISSLRMQLRADSEEILERRRFAWSRLLAVFRGVYGGIDHPTLRLPALGGSLELIWSRDWETIVELRTAIEQWVVEYNEARPHQALKWRTPAEQRVDNLKTEDVKRAA